MYVYIIYIYIIYNLYDGDSFSIHSWASFPKSYPRYSPVLSWLCVLIIAVAARPKTLTLSNLSILGILMSNSFHVVKYTVIYRHLQSSPDDLKALRLRRHSISPGHGQRWPSCGSMSESCAKAVDPPCFAQTARGDTADLPGPQQLRPSPPWQRDLRGFEGMHRSHLEVASNRPNENQRWDFAMRSTLQGFRYDLELVVPPSRLHTVAPQWHHQSTTQPLEWGSSLCLRQPVLVP